jgi:hypothetical protein
MYRRAYALLIGVATVMGILAVVTAAAIDKRLLDPDGFLGPSWLRLPLMLGGAFVADLLPRALWQGRKTGYTRAALWHTAKERIVTHWNRERVTLVIMGLVCFYITYVSYRNLKSFLPFVMGTEKYDRALHRMDQALFFGREPAVVLHDLLGQGLTAHLLSGIYIGFLPLVPFMLIAWLTWARNISYGYWFVTSQVMAWTLGTASYYALPTVGPGFYYSWLYKDLAETGTTTLMNSLSFGRNQVVNGAITDAVQSVAGFASLHCAITLLFALMAQYTLRSRVLHWVGWVNFGLTVIATLYFGWHYIADDIAGIAIALFSFYLGAVASGQKFDRHGLASHPTTSTSVVPVDEED